MSDHDRSLDDDRSETLQKPLPPGDVEALREALEALDRVDKECPVRRSNSAVERCPSCRATSSDGCGMAGLAGGRVIEASRQVLAALSTSPGGWRDIESAPRDGTIFLAVNMRGGTDLTFRHTFCFSAECPEGQTWAPNAGWRCPGRDWPAYPTHWQPLPPPPVGEKG